MLEWILLAAAALLLPLVVEVITSLLRLPSPEARRRGQLWCCMLAALWGAVLVFLSRYYDGKLWAGLAGTLVDGLMARSDGRMRLFQLLASGVLQLKATQAEIVAIQLSGVAGMSERVVSDLCSSLQLTLSQQLQQDVPMFLVMYTVGMSALCTAVGDHIRSRKRGWSDLPPASKWFMPRSWTLGLMSLFLPRLLSWLDDASWLSTFAGLCYALLMTAAGIQAVCLLLYWRKHFRATPFMVLMVLVLIVVMPGILPVLGLADQLWDFRHLREPLEFPGSDDFDE